MDGVPHEIEVGVDGLVLRRWRMDDAPILLAEVERSLPELRRFMPWAMEAPSLETVGGFLERVTSGEALGFGLYEADGALVGGFGLHDRRGPGILEIGYWVRTERTGRGYATAAARALTSAAFEHSDVDRVEIHSDPANGASGAIAAKLGYRLDAEIEVPIEAEAQTGRQLVWAVTRAEWACYLATERW